MLEHNVTQQENAIEVYFAKPFDELTKYPMDNDTAEIYIKLVMSKNSTYDIPEDKKPFLYKLMEKRIELCHSYKVDDRILLFLSFIGKSAGNCVMYMWYLQYQSKLKGITHFTFEHFAEIFPFGFPSEEGLQKVWDGQKVARNDFHDSDNLLDYARAGASLYP